MEENDLAGVERSDDRTPEEWETFDKIGGVAVADEGVIYSVTEDGSLVGEQNKGERQKKLI